MKSLLAGLFTLFAVQAACAQPPSPTPPALPQHAMVTAANPLAAQAGLKVLREGGSAVDAAVAVQAVLGLVEPQSSGIGGGAFMVYYDAKTHMVTAYDGREVAPAGAGPDMFLKPDGKPMGFGDAILSGRSAGTPGAIAMLYLAHGEHGVRPWRTLFDDGRNLARDGFVVSPRLAGMIQERRAPQPSAPDAVRYFTKPDGTKYQAGDVLKNPAYAATLERIAAEGPKGLLTGPIAADIVARLAQEPLPGAMTLADLAAYKPHESKALCRPYRAYLVCAPQAPSGGPAILEALGLLQNTDIGSHGPTDPQGWLQLAMAQRLMYADRDHYEGDPKFVNFPLEGLLDPQYLADRAKQIGDHASLPQPGHPAGAPTLSADATREPGGTSHMVIVDPMGDVLSMTTTVESIFGDGRMVDGFFLNNQLTDFSFSPKEPSGAPIANAVAAGKRPRSSMSPVIILDSQGRFFAAIGSPGGNTIPAYVLKVIVGVIDWHLTMQQAIDLPNLVARGSYVSSESALYPPGVVDALAAKGISFQPDVNENSGLHGVVARPQGLEGGADKRREGEAIGRRGSPSPATPKLPASPRRPPASR